MRIIIIVVIIIIIIINILGVRKKAWRNPELLNYYYLCCYLYVLMLVFNMYFIYKPAKYKLPYCKICICRFEKSISSIVILLYCY